MTCPAKLTCGTVDQGAGMLSEDVIDKGYVLLCVATPTSDDVAIAEVEQEELLELQMNGDGGRK